MEYLDKDMLIKWGIRGGVALVVLFIASIINPLVMVDAGHRGVVKTFGAVSDDVLDEGIHLRIPLVQQVIELNVQINKAKTRASAASKDLQEVSSVITLNWHPEPSEINKIYQKIGTAYASKVIDPAVQETVKSVTALYTAEELITKRAKVAGQIETKLRQRLDKFSIKVDQFSVEDFNFSKAFSDAIESKQVAEQDALKARRQLDRIRIEAEQKVATARAEATELRLKRKSLSPMMVRLRWIEKWDGKLPTYVMGSGSGTLLQVPGGK